MFIAQDHLPLLTCAHISNQFCFSFLVDRDAVSVREACKSVKGGLKTGFEGLRNCSLDLIEFVHHSFPPWRLSFNWKRN